VNIEEIMKTNDELIKKGSLAEGDVELWDDGTITRRNRKDDIEEEKRIKEERRKSDISRELDDL
jgi:hypothetical protein